MAAGCRSGLFTKDKIDEAYSDAWAEHRKQCAAPTIYRTTEKSSDGWDSTYLSCPNCAFRMKVSRPTWKTTKPLGGELIWWLHD